MPRQCEHCFNFLVCKGRSRYFWFEDGCLQQFWITKKHSRPAFLWQIVASFWRRDKTPKAACPSSKRPGCGDDSGQSRGSSERRYDRCVETMVISDNPLVDPSWHVDCTALTGPWQVRNILPQAALGDILGVRIEASVVFRGSVTSGDKQI